MAEKKKVIPIVPESAQRLGSGGDYGRTTTYLLATGEKINVTREGSRFKIEKNPKIVYIDQ